MEEQTTSQSFDLARLKALDAALLGNHYDDKVFAAMLPHVQAYLRAAQRLRQVPTGEQVSVLVMLAGGER